jgi:hypothetical protein
MKNNTLLLIGAALVYFYWMKNKNKKAAVTPENITQSLEMASGSSQIETVRSQTVNFPQLAPTPASILDLPSSVNYQGGNYPGCNCCNQGRLSGMPVVC